jgi:hypothetical protein
MAEKLLEHINETIREQESYETLKNISQNLWIGTGWVFYLFFRSFSSSLLGVNECIG